MFQNNPNDHLITVCQAMQSEMHQSFQNPVLKKPAVTRAKRLEQFLWHELYDEYIRSKQRMEAMRPGNPTTEYFDEFGKPAAHLAEQENGLAIAGETLINKFPLYSSNAISVWNPKGEFSCKFRRAASITVPTSDQCGQFDD